MRVMGHGRAPGVQHQGHTETGTQVFRVRGNRAQRLGRGLEQQAIDYRLVVPGDGTDRGRQGEHQVVILDR